MTSRSLVLLSGESTSIPDAEAKALFLTYDPSSKFDSPEGRVLLVESKADPLMVASRIAFARRVGRLIFEPAEVAETVRGKKVRLRCYSLTGGDTTVDAGKILRGLDAEVDLVSPDFEFTLVKGRRTYLALTSPLEMKQEWSLRRPRKRAFFHPSAIFPKLSRALVNLSRCKEGEVFLDPFAGTGSLPIEAAEIGARVLAMDQTREMTKGALANMKKFGHEWLGVLRCDSFFPPVTRVDAIATDVPYGRASSTRGKGVKGIIRETLEVMPSLLKGGSRMVIMHAKNTPVEPSSDWAFEEEHYLYVHKRLTRAITVLRRR